MHCSVLRGQLREETNVEIRILLKFICLDEITNNLLLKIFGQEPESGARVGADSGAVVVNLCRSEPPPKIGGSGTLDISRHFRGRNATILLFLLASGSGSSILLDFL